MSNNLSTMLLLLVCVTLLLAGCPQTATETHATTHHATTTIPHPPQTPPTPTPTAPPLDTAAPLTLSSQPPHYRVANQSPQPDNTSEQVSSTPSLVERPHIPPAQRDGMPPIQEAATPQTADEPEPVIQSAPSTAKSIQNATDTACDTASGRPIRIIIQDIDLDQPVFPVGLDANNVPIVLKHDIGWYLHSARPGEGENIVLWGHVLPFQDSPDIPAPFARMKEADEGTDITIITDTGAHCSYTIRQRIWATPEETHHILPQGTEQVTLVSCIGEYVSTSSSVELSHRLITIAEPTR